MRNSMPFWETCTGNVSRNDTCRPTRVHNALLSVKVPHSSYECGTVCHSGRHAQAMSPGMTHADQQECTMHSCRSKFRIQVMNAEQYAILGDMHRQCLPE
ncbi:hypothetical protein TVAGG3_0530690 [Trichomonas vaginalis G3]|uniref:hypothetical protein n=1 Tax=Trichomonas vaginalis (strain ATCC PRA-98 / G3) TaxID=412133 RepID=UPI0021E5F796|nr:hypothetical protein TVAGG3_0530690 [Trichomonas vaginalis G3]KAI5519118.1 hypothetical protein TVAGG3_0530690 [Trichomonas vaginalis G3]